jgi:hypothetical protein
MYLKGQKREMVFFAHSIMFGEVVLGQIFL